MLSLNKLTFEEGEKREVLAVITSRNSKEAVVIASADFELKKTLGGAVIQTGSCEIAGNEVTAFLDLTKKGEYELKITSYVGREKIIKKTTITVK